MKLREIAAIARGTCEGDPELEIRAAAPVDVAGPDEISFVGSRKAAEQSAESKAGCLIVPRDFPPGRALIRCDDPRGSFARVIEALHPHSAPPAGVHPAATVSPDAVIGEGTSIGPGCSIEGRVHIGKDCVIHANVSIYPDVTLGDRVIVHSGCVIGADGFGLVASRSGYRKFPQIGRVEISDDVELGANCCVDRAALGVTFIGAGTKLDNMVHVGHNCRLGRHVVVAAQTGFSGGVVVEDWAVIGGQVGVGDKARIESGVVLGSGSGVLTSKIVRKGTEPLWGVPAKPLHEHLLQLASLARLPKLRGEIADLKRRLEELERR
ncbi:MAG TPA: UDP-3-O-(3-hydroxymyristoyl)glucosamine N-acyltransferase [Bryobacteraceae bacterium]|nr:UDP-3-O-(3-hydroxymyristoyl)glucosamine N-acyltransferase [Bryobacteraceae bacterium]